MRMRLAAVILFGIAGSAAGQHFYEDDPLTAELPPRPVTNARARKLSDYYDVVINSVATPGARQPVRGRRVRATNVNTMGEPLEGSWYTRRHYYKRMSLDELAQVPGGYPPPDSNSPWLIVAAKTEGITPGFVVVDSSKRKFFVKFDPRSNPEMATGAEAIATRIFYALGYHVPANFLVEVDPKTFEVDERVSFNDPQTGIARRMTHADLDEVLWKAPKTKSGKYRVTASLALEGQPLGPFRYYGTRSDDPNDVFLHEHHRELRGLHVFCAWLNHDDSRAINTLDTLIEDGVPHVRHHLIDFGSTLGSASDRWDSAREGGDYMFGWRRAAVQLFSLGLVIPEWARASYPRLPGVGRFEAERFAPDAWKPQYPNPAFNNRLADDEFWAARQVANFTDEELLAIVKTAQYSDARSEQYIFDTLRARRDKIARVYFAKVLPLDRFRIENNQLKWNLPGASYGITVGSLNVQWFEFHNGSAQSTPLGFNADVVPTGRSHGYLRAEVTAQSRPGQSIDVYVRLRNGKPSLVGVEYQWPESADILCEAPTLAGNARTTPPPQGQAR